MTATSHNAKILAYMQKGGWLTKMKCLKLFNCFSCSSRISNLRAAGHKIKSKLINVNGKWVSRYWMEGKKK